MRSTVKTHLKPSEDTHSLSQRFMSFKTIYLNDGEMKTFLGSGKTSLLLANIGTPKNPSEPFSMKYKYMKIAQIYRRNWRQLGEFTM